MDYTGRTQLSIVIVSPAELAAEGDRIFASHAAWMQATHHRDGDEALLQYLVAKGPRDDGSVVFVLTEVYATPQGVADHLQRGESWADHDAWHAWIDQCSVTAMTNGEVRHSLW